MPVAVWIASAALVFMGACWVPTLYLRRREVLARERQAARHSGGPGVTFRVAELRAVAMALLLWWIAGSYLLLVTALLSDGFREWLR